MITKKALPSGFVPYEKITLCGNKILGGGVIFAVGEVVPLLIGRGAVPLIWLQALSSPNSKVFVPVLNASVSSHPAISVVGDGLLVTVKAGGVTLLRAKAESPDSVTVDLLDLRPLGLNVHGDKSTLMVGSGRFTNSTLSGTGAVFQFD